MTRIGRALKESFIPLFLLLVAILGATVYVDSRAEEAAQELTVVQLTPSAGRWSAELVGEDGMAEGSEAAAADPEAVTPELEAARALARKGDRKGAEEAVRAAMDGSADDAVRWNEVGVYALQREDTAAALEALDRAVAADPRYFRAHYNRGVAHAKAGDPAAARADYEAALAIRPQHYESSYNLGLLMLDRGDVEGAVRWLKRAVELGGGPARARSWFSLGRALARGKQRDEAIAAYERAIEYQPAYPLPRYNQAVLFAEDGTPVALAKANALLQQTLTLQPDFAPAWFLRGVLLSRAGNDAGALEAYETAARFDARFWKARYNAGVVALRLGRTAQADQVFSRLAADFPERPEAWFNLGRVGYRREDFETARGHYEKAIELSHGVYPEAQLNLGLVLRALEDYDGAMVQFDGLLAADPENAAAWLNRGLVLQHRKQWDEARAAFLRAAELREGYAGAWYNLGKLESKLKRHQEASEAYARALEADAKHLKAAVNLGIERGALKDDDGAVAAFRRAIEIAPDYGPAYFNLGLALRRQGTLQEALTAYQKVLDLDPESVAARQNLGVCYARLGQSELAARMFNEALDIDPSLVLVRYNLSIQYKKQEMLDEAEVELRRVLKLKPDYPRAVTSLAGLLSERGKHAEVVALIAPKAAAGSAFSAQLTYLGQANLALGRLAPARDAFAAALERKKENLTALLGLAEVAEREGDRPGAIAWLDRARTLRPKDTDIRDRIARLATGGKKP